MRTYRGIVCEKKNRYMVFLTENGEFLRGVPIGDTPEVGEEADFKLVASSLVLGGKSQRRFVSAVLVAAALLFFFISPINPLNEKVMAYVQLEADTTMEFEVDQKGAVISLRYLSESTVELDHLSEWQGRPFHAALDKAIVELSNRDKEITITTVYHANESNRDTRKIIDEAVQKVRNKHVEMNFVIMESTPKERKIANKNNTSIHQFKTNQNEKSLNEKQPVEDSKPIDEEPIKNQKEQQRERQKEQQKNIENPKKENIPSATSQQKRMDKERLPITKKQTGPPAEKEKNLNRGNSGNVQPETNKKVGSPNSQEMNKQRKDNDVPPGRQKPSTPVNEKKPGSGPPS